MKSAVAVCIFAGAIQLSVAPTKAQRTITIENPLDWFNSNIVQGGILEPGRSWLNSEYTKYFAKPTAHASTAEPKQTATIGLMDGMPGMDGMSSMAQNLASFVQSIVMDVTSFNAQAAQQLSSFGNMVNSDVSSIGSVLETNSIVSGVLLPFTNFQEFYSDAHDAVTNFQTELNSELGYLGDQFNQFTSAVGSDINTAAIDAGNLLTSLYTFVQKAIDIMLSSPLLTATTLVNPVVMLVTMLLAADPVKLIADYSAWESEVSSRQTLVIGNYNSIYTFISTGLPQAENAVLGLMSQFANFGSALANGRIGDLQRAWLRIAHNGAENAVVADLSRLALLSHDEVLQSALQSAVYQQRELPSHTASPDAEPIEYMAAPTAGHQTATKTHQEPSQRTLTV
ncbi:hypothetical protein IWW55_003329 [Coemansia sp. RSA 2706]|nr:hypothetical protein IWW55_003329 [Coemansia sp. RSA 2706]KAJ2376339.1 hypothetical protein H4S02_007947 [Coemansia sp. RSA 2611]